ncbi:unnamed protein product [Effrenium voratum]|nr:unnamed protein product [Effrenium voratum]
MQRLDPTRLEELTKEFVAGNWGVGLHRPVRLLKSFDGANNLLDNRGLMLVDDGLHTITVLSKLQAGGGVACPKLRDLFENGVPIDYVCYAEDSRDLRILCQTLETNLEQKLAVIRSQRAKVANGDPEQAVEEILKIYGAGKKQLVHKWKRAELHLPKELQEALGVPPLSSIPQTYVFDNPFLMGFDANSKKKMSGRYGLTALHLWEDYKKQDRATSASWFKTHVCAPLRAAEVWEASICKKFGRVAQECQQFWRVTRSLQTPAGIEKVRNCQSTGVPLHGTSDSQAGIVECRTIYLEMAKQLAGSDPQTGQTATAEAGTGGQARAEADDEEMATEIVLEVEEDPELLKAKAKMIEELSKIITFRSAQDLKEAMKTRLHQSQRVGFVIDAQTSRPKITISYLELVHEAVQSFGLTRWTIIVMAGHRLDLLHTVCTRANTLFKADSSKASSYVVQVTSGQEQVQKKRPGYVALIHSAFTSSLAVPTSSPLLTCRAKPIERARLRCTDRHCKHRPEEAQKTLDETAGPDQEINGEDLEEENLEMQDDENPTSADMDEDDMMDRGQAKRDFLVDLFPYTRPVDFYKRLMEDVARLQSVGYIVGMSTSSHPALPLACRLMGTDCLMLVDRPTQHSINHAHAICEDYLLKKAQVELSISFKRRLQTTELQYIDGGKLAAEDQVVEWLSLSADSADKFSGINEWPSNLRDISIPLIQQQLDDHSLAVADFAGRGKGLVAMKPLREGAA